MSEQTETLTIETIKRGPNSRNGNPSYWFTFTDGTTCRSSVDSGFCYAVGNPDMREGCTVRCTFTPAGRVRTMAPAGPDLDVPMFPDYSFPSRPHRTPRELFREGYAEGMLWVNCTADDELPEPDRWGNTSTPRDTGVDHIAAHIAADPPAAILDRLREDADDFLSNPEAVANVAEAVAGTDGYGWDSAGHDFALTRNGHGAGFWDRGLPGETGDRLTELAESYGSSAVSVWVPFDLSTGANVPDDDPAVIWEVY